MTVTPTVAPLYPEVDFPEDPGLSELPNLFNPNWVWETFCQRFERPENDPHQIRIRQFSHSLGRSAIISYEVEWHPDDYLPSQHFTVRIDRGKPAEAFQYPDDPLLPGLSEASYPETALRLLNRHVLAVGSRRARVEVIRYRPGSRAVLRHSLGRVRFYARVMRLDAAAPLLAAREPIGRSSFVLPRLAGYWAAGGVNVDAGNSGHKPAPLHPPGQYPGSRAAAGRPGNPVGAAGRSPTAACPSACPTLTSGRNASSGTKSTTATPHPGASPRLRKRWTLSSSRGSPQRGRITTFTTTRCWYCPTGGSALVDFEEAGPGDPMLDVGNFLAHLMWRARLGRQRDNDASAGFHDVFRQAALDRFRGAKESLPGAKPSACSEPPPI